MKCSKKLQKKVKEKQNSLGAIPGCFSKYQTKKEVEI